jgi:Tol biopolymer transport system component
LSNTKKKTYKPAWFGLILTLLFLSPNMKAQFYNGSNMTFGKNRVQFNEFLWTYYKFDDFDTYFYLNGKELAEFTAEYANQQIPMMESKIESYLDKKIKFIIFNNLTDLKQSNIGLITDQTYNTGGITHIIGTQVLLYFDGNHVQFQEQINAGIAEVLFDQMMFGGSLGQQVKTATFFSIPDWYKKGMISYLSQDWSVEYDNRVRDGILSGRYKKVNNINGPDAVYAGHSLWRYIAMKYGETAVSNIIHMTSVSNSVDKGIMYVIGLPFKRLIEEWRNFYMEQYSEFQDNEQSPDGLLDVKFKNDVVYGQPQIDPFGRKLAYTSNDYGKYKIYLYDLQTDKRKKIFKSGTRIDTKTDYSYPLLAWHPTGKLLSFIIERKGMPWLYMYNLDEKKMTRQIIYNVQKVTDFSYSDDGRFMVMSAVQKGQSDIFVFNIAASSFNKITDDIYTDLNPRFINRSSQIVFSSNRNNDTLGVEPESLIDFEDNFDLYVYNYAKKDLILKRITETPIANEVRPESYGYNTISYLSDENGIYNTYLAAIDSTVSSVDTSIHYRYFVRSKAITDYSRNIQDQHTSFRAGKKALVYYDDNTYKIYVNTTPSYNGSLSLKLEDTPYMALLKSKLKPEKPPEIIVPVEAIDTVLAKKPEATKLKTFRMVYVDEMGNEFTGTKKEKKIIGGDGQVITISDDSWDFGNDKFKIPKRLNYRVEYFLNDMISQVDFTYINYSYQPFTGGGGPIYLNPGFNVFFQMGVNDLMEDHRFVGGVRLNFSLINNEYLFSYSNLKKRLDREIVFHRNTLEGSIGYTLVRVHSHELFYILKWPFNEALSLRGTAMYRNDMYVALATDQFSLELPNEYEHWAGLKTELVFDNTRNVGMNLYYGLRYKLFAEYHQLVDMDNLDRNLFLLGFDIRHYQKISRTFIWANRIAGSTSLGNDNLIYYMGGVDNWLIPKFNYDTPIDYDQNYAYQTLATNMRGFNQNIRNGNSFLVINSELRFPLFQYFSKTPLSSGFLRNFQLVAFGDIGTAWTGVSPYSPENALYTKYIQSGPLLISVEVQKEPIVGGFGFGARMHLLGYFIRGDVSWGVEDYQIRKPVYYLSLSLDF